MKSIRRIILSFALLFISVVFTTHQVNAGLLYYSHLQRDADDNLVSLPPGSFHGNLHSNDYFCFAYQDSIIGRISCGGDRFIYQNGMRADSIFLSNVPLFNLPELPPLPRYANNLRAAANPWINDGNGRYMTRIWMKGENGITIYQYQIGMEAPSLYDPGEGAVNFHDLTPQCWGAIFVDGQVEIYGVHCGNLTIGSSGDMWLVDNIRYLHTNPNNGYIGDNSPEAQEHFPYTLGLVSESDIIIKDNAFNGRGNGWGEYDEDEIDHHSIIINAGLVALNSSLRIEHTNADWERYQGPSPDLRGIIYLTGALVQRIAAPLYFENHDGTGYRVDFHYDHRFNYRPPPFTDIPFLCYLGGDYYHTTIAWVLICNDVTFRNGLSVFPGGEINFRSHYRLLVEGNLGLVGSEHYPIRVKWYEEYPGDTAAVVAVNWGSFPKVRLRHTHFEEGVDVDFFADSTWIDSCTFAGDVRLRGNYVEVTNSHFTGDVKLDACGTTVFNHNIVEGRLKVDGNARSCRIFNNTIVNPDGDGVFLDTYRSVVLNSNIIAFCERGIVNEHWNEVELLYNNVFANSETDYFEIEPGAGSISADPNFLDAENGDYHLEWNSSCIDAGDPELSNDPDGTRADIGAYFHHRLGIDQDSDALLPMSNIITLSPNPFNSALKIVINTSFTGTAYMNIFDISGRHILQDQMKVSAGVLSYSPNGSQFNGAGVYIVSVRLGNETETVKVIYLP
ncbi:MAG: T9SS type A sorting domain-containing protein [Calditrichaeota bacterium]|nr:T9SS type A sorting domain-containing protein [Calditrichota bacterium]